MITAYEDRIYDAREDNQYISLSQRVRYIGDEYVIGNSTQEPDHEGLFNDEELKEEEQLHQMMEKFLHTPGQESQ